MYGLDISHVTNLHKDVHMENVMASYVKTMSHAIFRVSHDKLKKKGTCGLLAFHVKCITGLSYAILHV